MLNFMLVYHLLDANMMFLGMAFHSHSGRNLRKQHVNHTQTKSRYVLVMEKDSSKQQTIHVIVEKDHMF